MNLGRLAYFSVPLLYRYLVNELLRIFNSILAEPNAGFEKKKKNIIDLIMIIIKKKKTRVTDAWLLSKLLANPIRISVNPCRSRNCRRWAEVDFRECCQSVNRNDVISTFDESYLSVKPNLKPTMFKPTIWYTCDQRKLRSAWKSVMSNERFSAVHSSLI